ncbi:CCA tRNA nucleotidyltransferase [Candidatus Hepatincolaceae symbiont of Richtersius coronifer]
MIKTDNFNWIKETTLATLIKNLGYRDHIFKFVGGCVRDTLLGKLPKDFDIASNFTPQENIDNLESQNIKTLPTGIQYGTISVIINQQSFEITSLRQDIKTDGRKAIVKFTKDFFADACRRDFTFNALYLCPYSLEITDYFGGKDDLAAGEIIFIGDPKLRIGEDYLRILRFFRFYALYGKKEPEAKILEIIKDQSPNLAKLSPERVSEEFTKIIMVADPTVTLKLMANYKVLEKILPYNPLAINNIAKLIKLEEDFNVKNKILRVAFIYNLITTSKNIKLLNFTNFLLEKAEIKQLTNIITLKYIISKNLNLAFSEICILLTNYKTDEILYSLICLASLYPTNKDNYIKLAKKALEVNQLILPLNGLDIHQLLEEIINPSLKSLNTKVEQKSGQVEYLAKKLDLALIGDTLNHVKVIFWQNPQLSRSTCLQKAKDYLTSALKSPNFIN